LKAEVIKWPDDCSALATNFYRQGMSMGILRWVKTHLVLA
jgi:hypothetical protein